MMLEAGYVDGYRKFHGDEGHTFTTQTRTCGSTTRFYRSRSRATCCAATSSAIIRR